MAPKKDPAGAARFEEEEKDFPEDLDMARIMVNMMHEQRQERCEQQQERRFFQQQLLELQQQIMDNWGNNQGGGLPHQHPGQCQAAGGTKAKTIDIPTLRNPSSVTLADFRDWQTHFQGYVWIQKLMDECDREDRWDILRAAVDAEWMKLWSTGLLNVLHWDDVEEIMDKIGAYLWRLQNPLLDRKDFLKRKQMPRGKVDQFFAALQVIYYDSCAYNNHALSRSWGTSDYDCCAGHALTPEELRNQRLWDQLIVGRAAGQDDPAEGVQARDGRADTGRNSADLPGAGGIQRHAGATGGWNLLRQWGQQKWQ